MADLQKMVKKIILDVEQNLQNKEDLEYVKNQIYILYNTFMDELKKILE